MLKYLLAPYPCNTSFRYVFSISLSIGLFVFCFLYIFKPLGLGVLPETKEHHLTLSIIYSIISIILILFLGNIIPRIFPRYFNDKLWNTLKEIVFILFIVLIISIANYFITFYYYKVYNISNELNYTNSYILIKSISSTFLVALLPCILIIVINQLILLNKALENSIEINNIIQKKKYKEKTGNIVFIGEGKNEKIEIEEHNFVFSQASANYSEIYYINNNKLEKKLLRCSLSNIEKQILKFNNLSRVHRGFIVDLNKVINVSGSAQGYKLHFDITDLKIPVSRNKSKEIKAKLIA